MQWFYLTQSLLSCVDNVCLVKQQETFASIFSFVQQMTCVALIPGNCRSEVDTLTLVGAKSGVYAVVHS